MEGAAFFRQAKNVADKLHALLTPRGSRREESIEVLTVLSFDSGVVRALGVSSLRPDTRRRFFMARRNRVLRALILSCLLEGAIVCGIGFGFLGSGWVSGIGIGIALLSLAGLAFLARQVATKRW